jgi:transcriptional regulator with XRE-family HTH domain
MNIGLQLKIARIEKEWTQDQLSHETQTMTEKPISVATIINIERNQGNPKLKTVSRLVGALGYKLRIEK